MEVANEWDVERKTGKEKNKAGLKERKQGEMERTV